MMNWWFFSIDSTNTDQQLMTCTPKPSSSKTRSWKWISWTRVAMMRWGSWLYNTTGTVRTFESWLMRYSSKKVTTKESQHARNFGFPLIKGYLKLKDFFSGTIIRKVGTLEKTAEALIVSDLKCSHCTHIMTSVPVSATWLLSAPSSPPWGSCPSSQLTASSSSTASPPSSRSRWSRPGSRRSGVLRKTRR